MAVFLFSTLTNGQTITFDPLVDVLRFDDASILATNMSPSSTDLGTGVSLTAGGKTVFFQPTLDLRQLTTTNVTFSSGTLFLVGDNTTGTAGDDSANTLTGSNGADLIGALGGDDIVNAGGGNDIIFMQSMDGSSGGADQVDGGAGFDTVDYDGTAPVTVNLATGIGQEFGGGQDTLSNIEAVVGSDFNDVLIGGNPNAVVRGLGFGDPTETFEGGAGNDIIDGGRTDDGFSSNVSYENAPAGVTVLLGLGLAFDGTGGTDTLSNIDGVIGSAFGDQLFGGGRSRSVSGTLFEQYRPGAGADIINGNGGTDRVDYSDAPAAINVDFITGLIQDGFGFTDQVVQIDQVRGSAFNDAMSGSSRGEGFEGMAGNDNINGGGGVDAVRYQRSPTGVVVNLGSGVAQDGFGGIDSFTGIETAIGSDFDDVLIGGSAATDNQGMETFHGRAGNDFINGVSGTDRASYSDSGAAVVADLLAGRADDGFGTVDALININRLQGSRFNDVLLGSNTVLLVESFQGEAGDDFIDGRSGIDRADYAQDPDGVFVQLADGLAIDGYGNQDTLVGIEDVRGSDFADVLVGDAAANTIQGRDGNDSLDGGPGNDTLEGGLGDDSYIVESGGDVVTENLGEGIDTVIARINLTLGANVENLRLTGTATNGTGNGLDNALLGNALNNTLTGGDGNDRLDGGSGGTDTLIGGAGNDTYVVRDGVDTITENPGGGSDTVLSFIDLVLGANLDNLSLLGTATSATGNGLANVLTGNALGNVLDGGAGADTLRGGGGNDSYVVDNAADVVVEAAAAGTDAVTASVSYVLPANVESLVLAGSASINGTGNGLDNLLVANAGDNVLNGGGGLDTASYATATAGVTVNLVDVTAQNTVGAGSDTLTAIENLVGSGFNDTLTGSTGNNVIEGGLGNDSINGGAGVDTAAYLSATAGVTVNLNLATAQNTIAAGTDTLAAIENLTGSQFSDTLTGNAGNNVMDEGGGAGNDTMDGGAGVDTLSYARASAGVTISLTLAGAQVTGGAGSDTVTNFENLIGSGFGDSLTGNALNNVIDGGAGNDVMDGAAGIDTVTYSGAASAVSVNLGLAGAQETVGAGLDTLANFENLTGSAFSDTLTGNGGNNVIDGGAGGDAMDGGAGVDTLSYATATAAVAVNLGVQFPQNTSGSGIDRIVGFENLTGSNFNDTLIGDAGNNVLTGGLGNDVMNGGAGADTASYATASAGVTVTLATPGVQQNTVSAGLDTLAGIEALTGSNFSDILTGNGGANTLVGGLGDDVIDASDGNDVLSGAAGSDTLTGGAGIDAFLFNSLVGVDTLTDFVSGTDKFRFSQAGIRIGDGDAVIDGVATVAGPGGFAATNELVIVTGNVAGAITTTSAAAAIGSATAAYAVGAKVLFAVDDGSNSGLFLFTSAGADALVTAAELAQIAVASGTAATAAGDYVFVA